jgi:hypothetical protein
MVSNDDNFDGTPSSTAPRPPVMSMSVPSLNSALGRLSSHVNDQKLEKMATNFTRLVSILQHNQKGGGKLVGLLKSTDDEGGGAGSEEGDSLMHNPLIDGEIRDTLVQIFRDIGERTNK